MVIANLAGGTNRTKEVSDCLTSQGTEAAQVPYQMKCLGLETGHRGMLAATG